MADFDACDFYDCDTNAETLQHEHPEYAIIDFVDQLTCSRGPKLFAELESGGPVTVHGWTRLDVPDESITRWAECAADTHSGMLVRAAVKQSRVYACELSACREYSPEAVLAVIREHRPRWLEEAVNG